MVSRLAPSAERAASKTAEAMVKASKATIASASHCSDWIASNTGRSQLDWASIRAAGATSRRAARSWASRCGVTAPLMRASINAGTGMASASLLPVAVPPSSALAPSPSHGSISASTSSCGTCRTDATPGKVRIRATLACAWRARAPASGSTICTVTPPDSSASAARAVLRNDSPVAAASTVRATMIAITQGIGPDRRACGTSRASPPPEVGRQLRAKAEAPGSFRFIPASGATGRGGAAESAAPRWGPSSGPCRAA